MAPCASCSSDSIRAIGVIDQWQALALTLVVEAPIAWVALGRRVPSRVRRLAAGVVPSCITHPAAWHAAGNFGVHDALQGLLLIEALVALVETGLIAGIARVPLRVALVVSVLANGASALLGWVLA